MDSDRIISIEEKKYSKGELKRLRYWWIKWLKMRVGDKKIRHMKDLINYRIKQQTFWSLQINMWRSIKYRFMQERLHTRILTSVFDAWKGYMLW